MTPLDPRTFVELSAGLCLAYVVLSWRLKDAAHQRAAELEERDFPRYGPGGTSRERALPPGGLPPELAAGDTGERLAAMRALHAAEGEDAVPRLALLLEDPDPGVAEEAANLLGRIGGPRALQALLDADGGATASGTSGSTEDEPLPEAPAWMPGGSEPPRRPDLPPGYEEHRRVRPPPPSEPEEDAPPPATRLEDPLRKQGYRALHRYTPHDPETLDEGELTGVLLKLARDREAKPALRYFALKDLAEREHADLAETLLDLLRDPLPLVRYAAAEGLGRHGDADAVPYLVEALEDPEGNVRASAAHSLAALGGDMAIRPLLELRDDPEETVRYAARRALDAIGKRKRITTLLDRAAG